MPASTSVSNMEGLTADCARAITPFGFTERQARFLVTVMSVMTILERRIVLFASGSADGESLPPVSDM
jgi:hypothetical protein